MLNNNNNNKILKLQLLNNLNNKIINQQHKLLHKELLELEMLNQQLKILHQLLHLPLIKKVLRVRILHPSSVLYIMITPQYQ